MIKGKIENNGVINTKVPFFKGLVNILDNDVLINMDNDIQSIYNNWNDENIKGETDLKLKSKPVIRNKELLRHKELEIPISEVKLLGVDLPSWYGDFNSKNKIMIIGIDPMRGAKDFKKAPANETNDVLIGTPYAYHDKNVRKNKKNKNYTQFINSLLNDNNFVYLTDVYKTFFYYTEDGKKDVRSYIYYGKEQKKIINLNQKNTLRNSIIKTLHEEIKLINPTLIITLGGISFNQLTCRSADFNKCITPQFFSEEIFNDCKHIPIYPFMHLAARDANLVEFTKQYIPENISKDFGNLFFEIIKKNGIL